MRVTTLSIASCTETRRVELLCRYAVTVGRRARQAPREISAGWPNDALTDPVAESVRRYVVNLRDALGDATIRAAEDMTGVNHSTVRALLAGEAWPDAITVARTEHGLGRRLWDGPVTLPEDGTGEVGQ